MARVGGIEITHLHEGAAVADLLAALDEVGAVVVEGVIGPAQVASILAELDPWLERAGSDEPMVNPTIEAFFAGVRSVTGLTAKSPTFVDGLLLDPSLLSLADVWFEPVASSYLLNIAHLLVREPGSAQQFLHRDEDVWVHLQWLIDDVEPHPEVQLACLTALVDFTAEVGATRVVPGSHRWDRERQPEPHEVVAVEMPAGSSVIYRGSLLHGGGPNRTDRPRAAIHHSYVAGWLRTEEAGLLTARPDVARSLPRRAQELVGYGTHDAIDQLGGYLGVVDLQDPVDLLRTDRLRP